jgi:hypothetical protein
MNCITEDDDKRTSCKNLFGMNTQSVSENTQGNMDELVKLTNIFYIGTSFKVQSIQDSI